MRGLERRRGWISAVGGAVLRLWRLGQKVMRRSNSSWRGDPRPKTPVPRPTRSVGPMAGFAWDVLDLFGHQHALNGGLFGVYRHGFTGNFDDRVGGTDFKLDVAGTGDADLHSGIDDFGLESFGFHAMV